MASNENEEINIFIGEREMVRIVSRYVLILGNILGYWKEKERMRIGLKIELHVKTKIREYDRIFINGIDLTKAIQDALPESEKYD